MNTGKIKGVNTKGGCKIKINWEHHNRNISDNGYLISLPFCSDDEADLICHISKPQNPGGMDDAPPIWIHLYELLTNESVISININE